MGAIGGLIGLGGGAAGTSFSGPQGANLIQPATLTQANTAYGGARSAMASQNQLLQALQSQNGLANQNQVYGQLQGIASGAVNPAQAQFNLNTQQNVANQAALMAGQRGAGANVGLLARQAAQQGAAIQQQAVGQEAAQQAQNQIGAIGAAGSLATTQAGQQIGQTNANVGAQQAEQGLLLNALQGYNTNLVQQQAAINQANASMANTQMQGQQGLIGGVMNGLGGIFAGGGEAIKMSDGGDPSLGVNIDLSSSNAPFAMAPGPSAPYSGSSGPTSMFGKFLKGVSGRTNNSDNQSQQSSQPTTGPQALQQGMSNLVSALGKNGPSGSNISMPNGSVAGPGNNFGATALQMPEFAAKGGMAKDFRVGGKVNAAAPKEKAVASGNSYSNDKIPAVLSEHEIVLPRSVTMSKDPVGEAAKFVAKIVAKRRGQK